MKKALGILTLSATLSALTTAVGWAQVGPLFPQPAPAATKTVTLRASVYIAGNPVPGQTIWFALQGPGGVWGVLGTTDASGKAEVQFNNVPTVDLVAYFIWNMQSVTKTLPANSVSLPRVVF